MILKPSTTTYWTVGVLWDTAGIDTDGLTLEFSEALDRFGGTRHLLQRQYSHREDAEALRAQTARDYPQHTVVLLKNTEQTTAVT